MDVLRTASELENGLMGDTADYTWALFVIGSMIVYVWSARIPEAQVSLMGAVTLPAKYLPYANLLIDLVIGGPGLMLEGATGLASAFVWNYIRHARLPPGNSLGSRVKLDALLIKYLQPCTTIQYLELVALVVVAARSVPDRDAIRAATEARLRSSRREDS
ncbi:hypothetical protein MBRA1_001785 [Malassezia brasiliensis]|uniref:Derlin n=1 Tax=Malassezia brasiliensis TaxID=1821822 RepID=A0AAF0DW87_9BASI|nr:hypothetical protein MBRA1_001785 [Malassezia brasiliensis]